MPEVVEIHIRGVGGATAEEILGGPTRQISGDEVAGFHELRAGYDGREAYDWGRLTSGSAGRAIWWLLLPFSLFNVSGWMTRPRRGEEGDEVDRRSSLWLVRLLVTIGAYMMTGLYAIWTAVLVVDLVALDCGNEETCAERWYLAPLRWNSEPQARLVVGLIIAWLVLVVLLLFVKRSQDTTEGYEGRYTKPKLEFEDRCPRRVTAISPANEGSLREVFTLGDPRFWSRWLEHRRAYLRHVAAVVFTLSGVAVYGWNRLEPSDDHLTMWWLFLILGLAVVLGLFALDAPARFRAKRTGSDPGLRGQTKWVFIHLVVAVVGGLLGWVAEWLLDPEPAQRLGLNSGLRWLTVGPLVIALAIILVLWDRWLSEPRPRLIAFKGFRYIGSGIAAGLGVYILVAGFSSLVHVFGRFLLGEDALAELRYNETVVELFGLGLVLILAVTAIKALRRDPAGVEQVHTDYWGGRPTTDRELAWSRKANRKRRFAALPRRADLALFGLVIGILVVQLVQIFGVLLEERTARFWEWPPKRFLTPLFGWDWLEWTHATAAGAIVLFVFPGLWIIRVASTKLATRKQVGKVWDTVGFWPRAFHPLAAPCYAERAVPEFVDRIKCHVDAGRRVSIASHSQGTVIAVAALGRLAAEDDQRPAGERRYLASVALTTYGSPLKSLYRNFFPRYFGIGPAYEALTGRMFFDSRAAPWQNLWRPTDYIGQSVFGDADDNMGTEVDVRVLEARRPLYPINSHSDYETEEALIERLAKVRSALEGPWTARS